MFYILLSIHILLCVVLIFLVLVQQGKGADLGAVMGGSGSSVFGAAGATAMVTKITTGIAIGFMFTSIALARQYSSISSGTASVADPISGSVMEGVKSESPTAEVVESTSTVVEDEEQEPAVDLPTTNDEVTLEVKDAPVAKVTTTENGPVTPKGKATEKLSNEAVAEKPVPVPAEQKPKK